MENRRPQLRALFVGINNYAPGSGGSKLYGCIRDIEYMTDFLRQNAVTKYEFAPLLLRDNEATYDRVIDTFRSHLGSATAADSVLFMFAGHGSRQPCAPELRHLSPDGQDETVVCYDSRLAGGYDLADKELAVLIAELQAKHVLVILDCCHSGSGTRDQTIFRNAEPLKPTRKIESYLDGYYANQLHIANELSVPLRPHILLAACTYAERAAELPSGFGLFSYTLRQALQGDGLGLS